MNNEEFYELNWKVRAVSAFKWFLLVLNPKYVQQLQKVKISKCFFNLKWFKLTL